MWSPRKPPTARSSPPQRLPSLLTERDIDIVLIAGTVTNVCCESSTRDASTLGYRVIMLADANAALTPRPLPASATAWPSTVLTS